MVTIVEFGKEKNATMLEFKLRVHINLLAFLCHSFQLIQV
jgi:hypothetical protein